MGVLWASSLNPRESVVLYAVPETATAKLTLSCTYATISPPGMQCAWSEQFSDTQRNEKNSGSWCK